MAGSFLGGVLAMGLALLWPADGSRPLPGASAFASPASLAVPGAGDNEVLAPGPRIAIIVDDMGYEPVRDAEWLEFPQKLSVSILPFGPSSRTVADSARSKGYGVILQMPGEQRSAAGEDPEPRSPQKGMTAKEIEDLLGRMARDVPLAAGASNPVGGFVSDPAAMGAFAAALKAKGYFFVDSATADDSVAMQAIRQAGVPAVRRDVALDDDPRPEEIRRQWARAIALAKERGEAVVTCHSRKATLKAIRELIPDLQKEGIRPVTIQEMLAGTADG